MMNDTKLSPDDPRLTAYALGELQGAERAAIEAALAHDPAARAFVEQTREFAAQMGAALAHEPEFDPQAAAASAPPRARALPEYENGGSRILRFPQLYFIIGGLAAAGFAVLVALHEEKPAVTTTYYEVDLRPHATEPVAASVAPPAAPVAGLGGGAAAPTPALARRAAEQRADARQTEETTRIVAAADTGLLAQVKTELPVAGGKGLAAARPAESVTFGSNRTPEPLATATWKGPGSVPTPVEPGAITLGTTATGGAAGAIKASADGAALTTEPAAPPAAPQAVAFHVEPPSQAQTGHVGGNTLAGSRVAPQNPREMLAANAAVDRAQIITGGSAGGGEIVTLSPFMVASADKGRGAKAARHAPPAPAVPVGGDFVVSRKSSTAAFTIPTGTGSWAEIRRAVEAGQRPAASAVRIEELLNEPAFAGRPAVVPAKGPAPVVTAALEVGEAPWAPKHRLVRIAVHAVDLGGASAGGGRPIVAKNVKLEVEFNPARVALYRLIGYEKPARAPDAVVTTSPAEGTLEGGRIVTALYEIVPVTEETEETSPYEGTYGPVRHLVSEERARPPAQLLTFRVQYRNASTGASGRLSVPLVDAGATFAAASGEFKFAAGVAAYGMILRDSPFRGKATLDNAISWAAAGVGNGGEPGVAARGEFVELMRRSKALVP